MNIKTQNTLFQIGALVIMCSLAIGFIGLTSCSKDKKRKRSRSAESVESSVVPVQDPTMEDFRELDEVMAGTVLEVISSVAGKLEVLTESDEWMGGGSGEKPRVRCMLPAGQPLYKINFEPADQSMGTQRLFLTGTSPKETYIQISSDRSRKDMWVFKRQQKPLKKIISSSNPEKTPTSSLDDWVAEQPWFKKLASQMPKGVTLTISTANDEKLGWKSVFIRERHSASSGFDPNVSPLISTFRVSPNKTITEWMDPVSGDWASLSDFYLSQRTKPPVAPSPPRKPAADIDDETAKFENSLPGVSWRITGSDDDRGSPTYSLYLVHGEHRVLILEKQNMNFRPLSTTNYKRQNVPKDALSACHGWWAGQGVTVYIKRAGKDLLVYQRLIAEGDTDRNFVLVKRIGIEPDKPPTPTPTKKIPTIALDDWVVSQPWFKKLASQMPKGVTLTVNVSPATDPGWSNIHIRERRAPDSGFDSNVSPLVGTFRISPDRNTLKWLNPLTGDWGSLSDFYKSRNIEAEPPVAPAANKTADNLLFAKTHDAYYAKTIPAAEAFATFMMLAKRGNIDASYELGFLYYMGNGTQQDLAQAHRWFTFAAENGNPTAMFRLGYMYTHGKGVTKNTAKGIEYYLPAARAGHGTAAHNLGYAYAIGRGVKMDKKQARQWYLTAAKLGKATSMANLGDLYYRGEGVKQNRQLGYQWLLCGAARGSAHAAAGLGSIYSVGKIVKNDQYIACQWWAVAVRGGYTQSAENIKTTAKKMGWTNHEPRNFTLPKEMVEAKKGNLPPLPE